MKVKIVDLSERISVRYMEVARNNLGDMIKTAEQTRCTVWAKVYPLTARNLDTTPERTNKISYRVIIRDREGIKPDDEIIWRGRRLKLISPPYSLDGGRKFTAMECEEVIENGAT